MAADLFHSFIEEDFAQLDFYDMCLSDPMLFSDLHQFDSQTFEQLSSEVVEDYFGSFGQISQYSQQVSPDSVAPQSSADICNYETVFDDNCSSLDLSLPNLIRQSHLNQPVLYQECENDTLLYPQTHQHSLVLPPADAPVTHLVVASEQIKSVKVKTITEKPFWLNHLPFDESDSACSTEGGENRGQAPLLKEEEDEEKSRKRPDYEKDYVQCYRCPFPNCSKVFIRKSQLKIHARMHTGKNPLLKISLKLLNNPFHDVIVWHSTLETGVTEKIFISKNELDPNIDFLKFRYLLGSLF